MNPVEGLALYESRSCPYCARVRSFIANRGVRIETRDILSKRENREELIAATGRQMVPCLRITDDDGAHEWMFESADIIAFLRERLGEG